MTCRFRSLLAVTAAALATAWIAEPVHAAELPPIKTTPSNTPAACATPGRLMAYVKSRNEKMDAKFEDLATEYMRHGEALGVRWDYAFFQMLLETGYLKFSGDVKSTQNNFAGLGATGGGARGESFKDISTGARAHLEHILMYSGQQIENPVAQRTRNIQDWGVLTSWQKTISGPMTYAQLARQWAPTSKGYVGDIKSIADKFFDGVCKEADPHPEYVAAARGSAASQTAQADTPAAPAAKSETETASKTETGTKGSEIARRAIEEARAEAAPRSGLGAGTLAATAAASTPAAGAAQTGDANKGAAKPSSAAPQVTILNPRSEPAQNVAQNGPSTKPEKSTIETASLTGAGKSVAKAAKCRVWTASYGGAKAIIIKAIADKMTNYTVLDVNEGSEKRESDAYIKAYAKGGEPVGEFASQSQALDRAFELCPEG